MRRVYTRSNLAPFKYLQLSPPRRRGREIRKIFDSPRRSKSTPPSLSPTISVQKNMVPVAQALVMVRQFTFVPFNGGSPLFLAQHDDILVVALKSLLV